jgi:hypothetical protein
MSEDSKQERGGPRRRRPRGEGAAKRAGERNGARVSDLTPNQKQLLEDWSEFGRRLVPVLAALEEDEYLIVGIKGTNRFVQFAGQGAHGMRAEAVSNFYLRGEEQVGEAQHALLLRLGWHAPTNLPDEFGHEPTGSSNYYLDLRPPLDVPEIAALAVNTLLGPFDADHPVQLEYRSFAECGESIRWPTLGLRRRSN